MSAVKWGQYSFTSHDPAANWNDVAGIYIFSKPSTQPGKWLALYIGQASSFKDRLTNHERWAEALQLGATHVHAMVETLQANRDKIEESLIKDFQPQLNEKLK